MTIAAPGFLVGAVVLALGIVALHFLARRRPRTVMFPPARFVPQLTARAPAFARRPTDLVVLVARVLAVLLIGTAFARVSLAPRVGVRRIILLDRSAAVASPEEADAAARRLARPGDIVLAFDSTPRPIEWTALLVDDTLRDRGRHRGAPPGSLSAALVAAVRAAPEAARNVDSLELMIVSPLAVLEWDAATEPIRRLWPGRIALRSARLASSDVAPGVEMRAEGDDPVAATIRLAHLERSGASVLVRRRAPSSADSAAARAGGLTLVHWPGHPPMAGWPEGPHDTARAVVVEDIALVGGFERNAWPPPGRVVARWADGQAAATERPLGAGCLRDVSIAFPIAGDVALRDAARRLVSALVAPCGATQPQTRLPDSLRAVLAGAGGLAPAAAFDARPPRRVPATGAVLVAALIAVALEPALRRVRRSS